MTLEQLKLKLKFEFELSNLGFTKTEIDLIYKHSSSKKTLQEIKDYYELPERNRHFTKEEVIKLTEHHGGSNNRMRA